MKKVIHLILLVVATTFSAYAGNLPVIPKPSATLQNMWVDYDVTENNEYGMRMHIDFTTYELQGEEVYLCAFFQYTNDQTDFLNDRNKRYHSISGKVGVSTKITPTYNTSVYTDVTLFMPYAELDLDAGTYELTINVQLAYPKEKGGTIAWLKLYDIEYTQYDEGRGAGNTTIKGSRTAKMHLAKTSGPRATLEKMWVDHNITTENGEKGMIIHFKFTAYDMKDVEAYVGVYFDYNDAEGGPLKDKNQKYSTSKGNVAAFKGIYPGYATAIYDDLQLFMPYLEFDLDPGDYKLSFEALLIHKEGGLISKFGWHDFEYSRPK